jgi:hypothetical protein
MMYKLAAARIENRLSLGPGGTLMLHELEQFVTEVEVCIIMTALAELLCCRCETRYRNHANADHLFFDDPDDPRIEDRN